MANVFFEKTWGVLLGKPMDDVNFWIKKGRIPLGTLKPYEAYNGDIPYNDIVSIPFDDVSVPMTSRRALNILMLGGSGDGKSLIMKLIWSVLHQAGYYCGYIDPKSTDSGRAVIKWESGRLPPLMQAHGIPREHFMPVWATKNYQHLAHNFRIYSGRLSKISEREMWLGLGMTTIGASKVAKIIKNQENKITLKRLKQALYELDKEEMPIGSFDAAMRVLTDIEDYQLVDDNVPPLNLLKEWKSGKSVCVSYNNASKILMTYDIGLKIYESAQYYFTHNNRNPIMWFLDDSSFYDQEFPEVKFNFSVQQTKEVGYNYRSLGINNTLAVQSLAIIDEGVAESYKIKLISPLFNGVDSLGQINIPKKAINYLKDNQLVRDKSEHLMQWLLITEDNDVVPFFPFTPPCNHFTEIYFPKEKKEEVSHG